MAAEPTVANAVAASTFTETTRPATVAAADPSGAADEGEVGLPPHAASEPRATIEAA